jgi:hypothetical protein
MRDPDPTLEPYVSLVTYRRDGREVATPVWIADAGDRAYVFSAADAGKVKRLRRDARVKLAACSARGAVRGSWRAGRGRIVDDAATLARAYAALHAKYGWQMRLGDFFSKLTGRYHRRAMIEITLDPG